MKWKGQMRTWYGLIGLVIVLGVLLCGLFADRLSHADPYYIGPYKSNMVFVQEKDLTPVQWQALTPHPGLFGSSPENWARVVYGARWTLFFGVSIGLGRVLLGLLFGMLAGMGNRFWKWLIGRWYLFTTSIPPLLIYVLLFVPPILRVYPAEWRTQFLALYVLILIVMEAPRVALVVQGRLEELKNEPFYEGALAAGNTQFGALRRHLLPHLTPTLATQFASEVARGLLVMATLGIFSIYLSGIKIDPRFDPNGKLLGYLISPLVPEWGTMLADSISVYAGISTAPLLPASAFTLLIIGFTLLSDGMESLLGLLRRPLHWLRGRTSWWHGVVAAVGVAAAIVLLYHQGLPWGKEAGVQAVLQSEIDALAAGKRAGFLTADATSAFRAEQAALFDRLQWLGAKLSGEVGAVHVAGNTAAARITLTAELPDGKKLTFPRWARLARHWGRWQDEGYDLATFRTRLTTMQAVYDPWDITAKGGIARSNLQDLATFFDIAIARMRETQPDLLENGQPLRITYFPTDAELAASMGMTEKELNGVYLWYTPGGSLRLSPGFRKGENPQHMEVKLQQQLAKLPLARRLPNATPSLYMGRQGEANGFAKANVKYSDGWAGAPLYELGDLLHLGVADYEGEMAPLRTVQSIYLFEWLTRQVPAPALEQAMNQPPDQALQTLAAAAGRSPAELTTAYRADQLSYLQGLSMLKTKADQDRLPPGLYAALPQIADTWAKGQGVQIQELIPLKVEPYGEKIAYALATWQGPQGVQKGVLRMPVEQVGGTWQLKVKK